MNRRGFAAVFCAVLVFAFVGMVAYAVNMTPPELSKKVVRGELLEPNAPPVPNPGDTLLWDDGNPYWIVTYGDPDVYWAASYTPAENCTIKEGHAALYVESGAPPTCTLLIWDDNAGEPGTAVFATTFTPTTGWNYITVGTPVTFTAGTNFWIGYFLPGVTVTDTTRAWEDQTLEHGDRCAVYVSGAWYDFTTAGHPGDLCMRAFVEYETAVNHDVGPDSITNPPDTVAPDSTYNVTAWIHNWGDTTEVFSVECVINPGGYIDTSVVMGLAPGGDVQVAFTNWVVPAPDSTTYDMCVVTLLGTDTAPRNDTLCTSIYAVAPAIHDVGVDSVVAPADTVDAGADISPMAWVHNYGNQQEIFQVMCEIDSGGAPFYADTEAVFNLDPANSQQVTFAVWTVPPAAGVIYNTCVWTELVDDANPANDTLCRSSVSVTGVTGGLKPHRPTALALYQNVPNPFSSTTSIAYDIPVAGRVSISIYDATGGMVRTLVDAEAEAGYYRAIWDGRSDAGAIVPEGVYFYKLSVGELESAAKLVLVR